MHIQSEAPPVGDVQQLRHTLGTFATGVTVITVGGPTPHGMTANSFTAVSLDPPLVLACVQRDAFMHELLLRNQRFGVSVLAAGQEAVARRFADRRRELGTAEFDEVACQPGRLSGAPLMTDAAASLECALWRSYDGGDHTIFVGRLLSLDRRPDAAVLLFLNGQFHQLDRERSHLTA